MRILTCNKEVVVLNKKKKRGNQPDGSDFCNGLHRIPWYTPESRSLRTQRSPAFIVGAGKTSLILKCLPQFPQDYKVVLLKNEFGDVQGEMHVRQHRLELIRGVVAIFS